jgi:predicted dehydrogenase
MKNKLVELAARMIMNLLRYLAGRPDASLARLLGFLERTLRLFGRDAEDLAGIIELKELAQGDPEGMALIRSLIRDSRDGQLLALLSGNIRHYALGRPRGEGPRETESAEKAGTSLVRLGIAGDHFDLGMLGQAYGAHDRCHGMPLLAKDLLADGSILDGVNSLEISYRTLATEDFIRKAVRRGVAVSLHHACLNGPETLEQILGVAGGDGNALRVFHPLLYYPPVVRLKNLLDRNEVGEVNSIRVRATVGGKGGRLSPETPHPETYLGHPAFDLFLLMTFLGGCVEKVTAFLNPMDPVRGGQGLIDCKFTHPGRYGLMECTYAPEMHVRSDYYPYDLEVEIAGSDGIVWLTRGMGKRVQEAPLRLRVAREASTIGVECGLEEEWSAVYRNAASDLVRMVSGQARPRMKPEELISAFRLKERAYEASRSREVLAV